MIKKSIFTMMLLAVMGCWASAQSLQFEWNGHVFGEGEEITCTNDEYGYGELIQHMQIRNNSSNPMMILIEKEVVEDMEGVMNTFCWGENCYGPNVVISPTGCELAPGAVNTQELSFHAIFGELFGVVVMKYYAYEESNPNDRISIIVRFHKSGEGVHETANMRFGQAYPNPASSVVNFDYSLSATDKASISVYNLLGQEVMSQSVNSLQGRLSISVADLNDGIYFCNLFVNGCAVKTEKFIVKK